MGIADVIAEYLQNGLFLDGAHRPMRLLFGAIGRDLNGILLPQYIEGVEEVCGGIDYEIWCVSATAHIELKELIGLPITVEFVTEAGALRTISGLVTEATVGDSDGGLCAYRLTMRDALSVMEMKRRTRVFHGMNELDIVMSIIGEWRRANAVIGSAVELQLADGLRPSEYPSREFTMQYNESDAAFIRRLLRRRGVSWFWRCGAAGSAQEDDGLASVHTLVLFDRAHQLKQNLAGTVRYHRGGATEQSDTITDWAAVRTLRPSRAERFSWDYKYPLGRYAMSTASMAKTRLGKAGDILAAHLEDYQVASPHLANDADDFRRLGELLVQRSEFESKCFIGHGTVRAFKVGEHFVLAGHPEVDRHPPEERQFVVTAMSISIENNLPTDVAGKLNALFERSRWQANDRHTLASEEKRSACVRFRSRITAVRRNVAIVPAFDPRSDLPSPPMQTAIVVGPEGEEVHCDNLGRVLVCFPGAHSQTRRQSASAEGDERPWDIRPG